MEIRDKYSCKIQIYQNRLGGINLTFGNGSMVLSKKQLQLIGEDNLWDLPEFDVSLYNAFYTKNCNK